MLRAVLLRHDLPDASYHYDWLIELPLWGEHRLFALRIEPQDIAEEFPPPLDPDARPFRARRLPAHRAAFLSYQGPLTGGRGSVQRVASGRGVVVSHRPSAIVVASDLTGSVREYRAEQHSGDDLVVRPA